MWPFKKKVETPESDDQLTPFDRQVLTLIELSPDSVRISRNALSVPGVGLFAVLKTRQGEPTRRMQYSDLDSMSSRTRRLSDAGGRAVYSKLQELLDSAQPAVDIKETVVEAAAISSFQTRISNEELDALRAGAVRQSILAAPPVPEYVQKLVKGPTKKP